MRKILWYSSINELDYEQQMLFARLGWDFRLAIPDTGNDYFFPVKARIDHPGVATCEQLVAVIREYKPDLLVHRYRRESSDLLAAAEETGVPILVWVTEQGPDRDLEWDRNRHFRQLAVNNPYDVHYFRNRGIEQVYYWPFGCVPSFHRRVEAREPYRCDFVGYGNPIYNAYDSKRDSVDTVVRPLIDGGFDVSLWGRRSGSTGGWLDVPGVKDGVHYKGLFDYDDLPAVNSSAKIVLGITSNGRYGAFGSRLARAMACGSFCIWAYSEGMEEMEEGYENHVNCCWTTHPDETLELARYYLENDEARERVAQAGQRLALDKLNYETLVPRIIEQALANGRVPAHSRYHAMGRALQSQVSESLPLEACWTGYRIMAHDATGLTSEMAIATVRAALEQGSPRVALRSMERFVHLFHDLLIRNDRSCDSPRLHGLIGRRYGQVFRLVDAMVEQALGGPGATTPQDRALASRDFLCGIMRMETTRRIVHPLVVEMARSLATRLHRLGRTGDSIRAFSVYRRIHGKDDLPAEHWRTLVEELEACLRAPVPAVPAPSPAASSRLPSGPTDTLLPAHWELFLEIARMVPLDRRRVLLTGDCIPAWAEYLHHNVAATLLLRLAAPLEDPLGVPSWTNLPDPRPVHETLGGPQQVQQCAPDALVYLALTENATHWPRIQQLAGFVPAGACVIVASMGSPASLRRSMEEIGLRVAWVMELEGELDFDFPAAHPLAGPLAVAGGWKELSPIVRLSVLAYNLANLLEPRISHVTLDPLEIVHGLYSWSEGYARVMQEVCETEGFACTPVTVRAAGPSGERFAREREQTLLEVKTGSRITTWDPMLGIGYEATVDELIRSPERGNMPLGRPGSSRWWNRYKLERHTGREFFAAVHSVARRPDLAARATFEPLPGRQPTPAPPSQDATPLPGAPT